MGRTIRERVIALMCVVTMVTATFLTWLPAKAADSTVVTVDDKLEQGFTPWTFSDVGIEDQTLTETLNWTTANPSSLDKTIFNGKILFPTGTGNDIGNLYIGGTTDSGDSLYSGFLIRGAASNAVSIAFADASGKVIYSKNLWEANTDTTLRGNAEMQFSLSVEYTNVTTDGFVTMQVGVFFNGKLYNNEYITISNVPERCLTQHVKWYSPQNNPALKSHSLGDITLENAPERDFTEWTFSDVQGITEGTLAANANWDNTTYISDSLDKTIFVGKVNLMADSSKQSSLLIGGIAEADGSKYRGFRFYAEGADKIKLGFSDADGTYYNENGDTNSTSFYALETFDETTAGVALRGNDDLQIAVSVEYLSVENNLVTVQVGVFFNGKLYDNTYYELANIPADCLYQNVRVHAVGASNKIASDSIEIENTGIYLQNAPEREFDEWSLDDLGFEDNSALTSNYHWENVPTTAKNLDKSLLNVKIYIPGTGQDAGQIYIGGATSGSLWRGFRILGNDSNSIQFHYLDSSGTANKIANFYSSTAGTQLRNNRNLQLSISFEYLSSTDTTTKVKIGVFFDGKLYNNTYYEHDIETQYLNRHIKWNSPTNSPAIASHHSFDVTLKNAPENDFDYWTLRDINISDTTITDDDKLNGHWNNTITNTQSLDKTIFHAKINFLAGSTGFGHFYIGGATDDGAYRGFRFAPSGSEKIQFDFLGPSGKFYSDKGVDGGTIATFDSTTAGTTLRGNKELQVSLSVEIVEGTSETINELSCADVKVGVFFDGKLYDNTYYTIADVPVKYLTNNIRWLSVVNGCELASLAKAENVLTFDNATISASHVDMYSENTGYGMATLIDGVVGQNDPYYLGAVGALQNETMTFNFNFDDAYSIDSVRLHKYRAADGFPVDFTISAYTAEGWKEVVTKTDYQSTVGWNEFNFADIVCSGIRLTVTENGKHAGGDTFGMHLTEFEAWGIPSSAEIRTPYTIGEEATVIAYGKNDSVLNDGTLIGNNGYRVLSDSQTESTKMQLMFDFPVTVDGIQLSAQEAGEFPSAFVIYAFTGSGWTAVHTETNYTPNATKTIHEFKFDTEVTCSSIMVEVSALYDIYDAGNVYGLQIQEIRLNGAKKDNGCTLLGDGNADALLTESEDMDAFRMALAKSDAPGATYEVNRDEANDCRDLVRMKRYFANEDRVEKTYDFTTLSLNVRCIHSENSGYLHPSVRAPRIVEYLMESGADLIGLQEVKELNETDWREILCQGMSVEGSPYQAVGADDVEHDLLIFYNAEKLQLKNSGVTKLSSIEGNPYYYQWAEFTDMRSGEKIFMTNTHFLPNYNANNVVEDQTELRKKEAEELLAFWKDTVKDEILVAVGDYNCYQNSEPANILSGDIWKNANDVFGDFGTLKRQIDHAFVNPSKTSVENLYWSQDTFEYEQNEEYYSDHPTLFVKLSYKK